MKSLLKRISIITLIICAISQSGFSQPFFKDYKKYLVNRATEKLGKRKIKNWVSGYLKKFKTTFDTVQHKTGIPMLNCDTLYMVSTFNDLNYDISWVIWNKKNSCSYQYNAGDDKMNKKGSKILIEEDAATKLNAIEPGLKRIVLSADTSGYFNYIESHPLPDYDFVCFVVAIRTNKGWKFVS